MGSLSSKEIHKNEYLINKITLGILFDFYKEPICINCKNENVFCVVRYNTLPGQKCYNYCRSCLYFPISIQFQAIYSIDLPLELKKIIFRRFMCTIT